MLKKSSKNFLVKPIFNVSYMWIHPHRAGVTRILDNLSARKKLFDITLIRSKSAAFKQLRREHATLFN